jgi:GT2 family glycosyltransferase
LDLIISIVTYNNQAIIEKTIQSIIQNTAGISYRIVVYDNNSTDETISRIKSIESNKIDIIESEMNHGFGYGHNQVINTYDAKYYLIYNPDLRVKDNILKELYEYMEDHHDIGMITPKITYDTGEIQYLCKQHPTVFDLFVRRFLPKLIQKSFQAREDWFQMKYTGYDKEFVIPYATGCFMFYRKVVLINIEGFDEKFFLHMEDADISRRTNEISKCVFYPHNSVEHLWARGSHKSLKQTLITIKSACYYFNKWGWKFY